MNIGRQKLLTLVGFFILSCITGGATYGFYKLSVTNPTQGQGSQVTIDKTTGQTLNPGSGQASENYGKNPAAPILIGFADFLNQGVTSADLYAFQSAVTDYFVGSGSTYPPAPIVSFSDASCALPDSDGYVVCTYILTVNQTTKLSGTYRSNQSGSIEVTLTKDNKEVYHKTVSSTS